MLWERFDAEEMSFSLEEGQEPGPPSLALVPEALALVYFV
jgi:hypothetical protein